MKKTRDVHLKQFVKNYLAIPDTDWHLIADCFRQQQVKRGEVILESGDVCRHLYFLESGLLRYFIVKDGEEKNKFFTVAPYFFTSQYSFNNQAPARETIQAIEDSVIWETTYRENQRLLQLTSWNQFAQKITQEVQFFTEEILEELQTETAENRYIKLLNHQPELLQRIPLKHLASFLGIAPQSLSRIRKKVMAGHRS
ncbi:Crp/Fnr family transcriptional regulator [Tunicatimonas pelagia]|uniref:Crp/Fnr family transcriptional regulator n=1 Tax=Tunicatimonas pelagia TaxID=931531 RepID=UPI002666A451|nr:Crp/Fnr family transcriptional regulator [Tunicatimonas pelagia]WKN43070.1 Crp/Fnr family transcriptional regulator [Tunicatimonas pelagia]